MKNIRNILCSLIIMAVFVSSSIAQAQQTKSNQQFVNPGPVPSQAPNSIVRTIKQDKKSIIWIASWEGVFKYDGKSFANVTGKVSSARFFSVLEDRKGNFWFASVGSGVYYYEGKSFKNFTSKDGLANDRVTSIYEDKAGTIWFGTETGVSRYDGKSTATGQAIFQNLKMNEATPDAVSDSLYGGTKSVRIESDSVHISSYRQAPPESWTHNDVNAIIEDKAGQFWFGTRGYARVYDGKTFTIITNKDGKPFTNVRCIIKDRNGTTWLGGADGLWRYNGKTFTTVTQNFVGYVYEDKKGNIWTSSESGNQGWVLSRYDANSLYKTKPAVTEIIHKPMIFGILEDNKGNIWFGDFDGVHRYGGTRVTDFK